MADGAMLMADGSAGSQDVPAGSDVPCNGCTRCCHGDAVRLLDSDDPGLYQTEPHPYMPGALMLAHKPNLDCVYLVDSGCSIHAIKPTVCREMDCRAIAHALTYTQARKLHSRGVFPIAVWERGRELLKQER